MKKLNQECKKIKKMAKKLKSTFLKEVGVDSWDMAVSTYPQFAAETALERFVSAAQLTGGC